MLDMDLIKRDVTELAKKMRIQLDQLNINYSMSAGTLRSHHSTGQNMVMVGFDDILIEVMDKLTGQQSNRQIIPIVGMGGIGKTTLARNIYVNPLIVHHFDILAWTTISQDYNSKDILLQVLLCLKIIESRESLSQMSEDELGEKLHKTLSGRRYLIIMDDMWSIEVWDRVKLFFPDNGNGSSIVITTRLSNLAFEFSGSCGLKMSFLNEDKSWDLLCIIVFGEEVCPCELEGIGKIISRNCQGLPLSIVTIGGLLAKSKEKRYWQYIAENLNSIVNSEDSEHCLRILSLSYNQLPVHLKPCFLYIGMFPEDHEIRVTNLIKLWVAEGFLKPITGKSLEVVAKEYLSDLIDRNLVLVPQLGSAGNIKHCNIHDLLRDLCIKEAEKHNFFHVEKTHSRRRIGIQGNTISKSKYIPLVLRNTSLARSLICNADGDVPALLRYRLLRVWNSADECEYFEGKRWGTYSLNHMFQIVNSRHLAIVMKVPNSTIPYSVYQLWNLHTLVVNCVEWDSSVTASFEIWKMPQLRHVKFYSGKFYQLHLPEPYPSGEIMGGRDDFVVLRNLQTLQTVRDFNCSEEVVKRIPNIKKLKIIYEGRRVYLSSYSLNNLCRLCELESLTFSLKTYHPSVEDISFLPRSLKKLTLEGSLLNWEEMAKNIGSLPNLQVLKLKWDSFRGPVWETVEGQFQSLKFLAINSCDALKYWKTESTHFPRLEHLHLRLLKKLKEIPIEVGDIPTLKLIHLFDCANHVTISAKEIAKQQEDLGNEVLQVQVVLYEKNQTVESLASPNFRVQIC